MTVGITAERLKLFAPSSDAADLAPALDHEAERCEINTNRRICHFLGQLSVESAGFTRFKENLNYSAERLMQVWPGRFPALSLATPNAHNPPALATKVYAGRLGNTAPGDGAKYIGRGLIQITGKANYADASTWTGLDLVGQPELAEQPATAAKIAADFWRVKHLNVLADANDLTEITHAINGGQTGIVDRDKAYRHALTIWRDAA